CEGKRFKDKVLEVEYRGKNLSELLKMTVAELRELFYDRPSLVRTLDSVIEMGLGYITIGQNTSSFSGGEAQRLKLLRLLNQAKSGKPSFLIFDEPTTGLSDKDVIKLLNQLRGLAAQGHTVLVVEHHMGFIKAADWLIEIGPEAADRGGQVVFEGLPSGLNKAETSITAKYLKL